MKNSNLFKLLVVAVALQSASVSASKISMFPKQADDTGFTCWQNILVGVKQGNIEAIELAVKYGPTEEDETTKATIAGLFTGEFSFENLQAKLNSTVKVKEISNAAQELSRVEKFKQVAKDLYVSGMDKVVSGQEYVAKNPKKVAAIAVLTALAYWKREAIKANAKVGFDALKNGYNQCTKENAKAVWNSLTAENAKKVGGAVVGGAQTAWNWVTSKLPKFPFSK